MKSVDLTTKILVIVLAVIISFLLLFLALPPFLVSEPVTGGGMMDHMMGGSLITAKDSGAQSPSHRNG